MSKKEDSIVLIAFANAFVEKVTSHFLSFFACALKGCRTSGQFAILTSADFLVVFLP